MQLMLFAAGAASPPPSPCGKTSLVSSTPTTMPSDAFLARFAGLTGHYNRQGAGGRTQVLCLTGALSPGASSTRNISACPSDAVASSLSQVLEPLTPPRYFLSAQACAGILSRAERRGKTLPPLMQAALEHKAAE